MRETTIAAALGGTLADWLGSAQGSGEGAVASLRGLDAPGMLDSRHAPRRGQPETRHTVLGVLLLAPLCLALMFCPAVPAASITYTLQSYPSLQSGLNLTGSITTDGTIGVLAANDIMAWSFELTNGYQMIAYDSGTTPAALSGLVATTTTLTLPEAGPGAFNMLSLASGNSNNLGYERTSGSGGEDLYFALTPVGSPYSCA